MNTHDERRASVCGEADEHFRQIEMIGFFRVERCSVGQSVGQYNYGLFANWCFGWVSVSLRSSVFDQPVGICRNAGLIWWTIAHIRAHCFLTANGSWTHFNAFQRKQSNSVRDCAIIHLRAFGQSIAKQSHSQWIYMRFCPRRTVELFKILDRQPLVSNCFAQKERCKWQWDAHAHNNIQNDSYSYANSSNNAHRIALIVGWHFDTSTNTHRRQWNIHQTFPERIDAKIDFQPKTLGGYADFRIRIECRRQSKQRIWTRSKRIVRLHLFSNNVAVIAVLNVVAPHSSR